MAQTAHGEVCFPLLVPEDQFKKEADHIKGFSDEVYWVTRAGGNELDVKLLLRPTSETAMYPIFSLWIRSHADLPLRIFQIVNAFRFDTKQTRAFIRMREFHFFEAHTCHASFDDAEAQIAQDKDIWHRLSEALCMPYLMDKRPEWDKFPGAYYSLGADILMPNGKALQVATIHHYRDNFSKAYGITFEDEKGEHRHVHQTTYGISERLLGGVVGAHGDDLGLVLPPGIVPIQVVVVPILAKGKQEEVAKVCDDVTSKLKAAGIRTHADSRDLRPGNKFFHWELRGVPLRVEIGMKDIEKGIITVARRDTGKRVEVPSGEVVNGVERLLEEVSANLMTKAWKVLDSAVVTCNDIADARKVKDKILRLGWCGEMSCAEEIEKQTETSILGFPLDCTDKLTQCAICGGRVKEIVDSAKTY
jgi:prolyl-tRNA synthetase